MSRLSRELSDPWGLLLAGVVGGVAGVLPGVGLLLGAAVGAAVYGVKVVAGTALGNGTPREAAAPPLLRPADGTPAAFWLARAERAAQQLDAMGRTAGDSATDSATLHAASEAGLVVDTVRRLAAQTVALTQALVHAEGGDLEGEAARLREVADRFPDDSSARRSADAVADRLAVRDRLRTAQRELDGRLQSSALGLEGLVARVAEVRATAAAVGELDPTADDLASLTNEVEGLRIGLADAEAAAQQALRSP